ncbi:MAG TPA: glycerol-3-phosphate dehydrogenase [Gemmatimonadaceae bacterium]|nr:glycerol-3-phosphate dehydrogenase [Gemmatimonadaceae bacterium]
MSAASARAETLARLAREQFDLLVIGGGINGAGIARDAALRGLRVALVEKEDFASGTSSRSSRLVHGGVRYLEHGHFHLVFESSRERRTLLDIAPHLVRPLEFTWPVYAGARVPRWKLAAGLMLYDVLALFRNVAVHRRLGARDVAGREPALRRDGLTGGASYYDAATDDARLTLANAIGAAEAGAVVANHVAVRALVRGAGVARGARAEDVLASHGGGGPTIDITALITVNATGPWSDELRRLEDPGAAASVRGTKGVHVAVPRERIGNRGALTLLSPIDGRVTFVLPAGPRHTIVGTTDTATDVEPGEVRATREDVEYLLRTANAYFPDAHLHPDDVVSAWAGIRPLVASGYGGAGDAASASREHAIARGPSGVITISGGKLTTYRAMSAEVVDTVCRTLGRSGTASTQARALPGGDLRSPARETDAARQALGAARAAAAEWLVGAYGSRWRAVWALAESDRALAAELSPGLPYIAAELVYGVTREMACTLGDLLIRRTHLAFETRDHGAAAAAAAAAIVAPVAGWDDDEIARQLAAYERESVRIFAVDQ